jgi:hypothetical protein
MFRRSDKKYNHSCFVALLVLLLWTSTLLGQASLGAISGTVKDPSGGVIPDAAVIVTNQSTGITTTRTSNADGFYSVEGLPVGQYKVDVKKDGFKESILQGIQIDPGQRRENDVLLSIGSATTQVTVTADQLQVNTETSENGGTVNSKQIANLMMNGRDYQTLAVAIPGVSSAIGADSQTASNTNQLIVNGSGVEATTQTIDGVYNMQSGSMNSVNIRPIVDGIAEFSVLKDNYSARYGFAGSGQVVVETKAGSDKLHGSAWEYLRNDALDARNYFATSNQKLRQNIYGYTVGGPVVIPKIYSGANHKTFFFASNQWYRITSGQVIRGSVFSQAMRNGDFSASPTLPGNLTLDPNSVALLAQTGRSNCILGPKTLNPACFDPVATGLMNAYVPLPNNSAAGFLNYLNQGNQTTSENDYQYRVDHYITPSQQLTARVLYQSGNTIYPNDSWGGTPYTTITDHEPISGLNAVIRLQSSFSSRFQNTFDIAETFDKLKFVTTKGGSLPSGLSYVQAFPDAPTLGRMPNISISGGWSGNGVGTEPISASDGEGIVADNMNFVQGRHVFQAGFVYMFGIKRQNVFTNPQGSFSFNGTHTGDPAADYLLGLDSSYSQASSQRHGDFHYRQVEAFVQDDWKVTPRLALNLGIRWQYFSNDTVGGNQVTSFDPSKYNAAQAPVVNTDGTLLLNAAGQPITSTGTVANQLNGLVNAGVGGVPAGFFVPSKANFGPRLGFAYDVFGNQHTALRGGYGVGYSRIPLNQIYNSFGTNPPYNQTANIINSLLMNGTLGSAAALTAQSLANSPLQFKPTQVQSYSLTLEQQLRSYLVATLGYAGSQTRHIQTISGSGYDSNFPLPVSAPSIAGCLPAGQSPSASYNFDPCINGGMVSASYTRPYKGYANMSDTYDDGMANYNSLQSSVAYRSPNLQISFAYTYSKTLTTVASHSAGGSLTQNASVQDPRNFHAEYGPPSFDFTNNISSTWVYNLSKLHGAALPTRLLLGSWSVAGLVLHQTGFALSPGLSTGTAGEAIRPNQVAPYQKIGSVSQWFQTTSFTAPAYGFFGNASNGIIRGPGYTSANVSLYKDFPIHDTFSTQFRAEAFNVLNHPNFVGVDTGVGSGTYGQVTSAGDPRILEFALKVTF